MLPTLLAGGFGKGAEVSSLHLALAIAQNGNKEQHSKLALSGILVLLSNFLCTALSTGDLYKFSAALALVRFCGPYVVTETNGGIQSVCDKIMYDFCQESSNPNNDNPSCRYNGPTISQNSWDVVITSTMPEIVNVGSGRSYVNDGNSIYPGSGITNGSGDAIYSVFSQDVTQDVQIRSNTTTLFSSALSVSLLDNEEDNDNHNNCKMPKKH